MLDGDEQTVPTRASIATHGEQPWILRGAAGDIHDDVRRHTQGLQSRMYPRAHIDAGLTVGRTNDDVRALSGARGNEIGTLLRNGVAQAANGRTNDDAVDVVDIAHAGYGMAHDIRDESPPTAVDCTYVRTADDRQGRAISAHGQQGKPRNVGDDRVGTRHDPRSVHTYTSTAMDGLEGSQAMCADSPGRGPTIGEDIRVDITDMEGQVQGSEIPLTHSPGTTGGRPADWTATRCPRHDCGGSEHGRRDVRGGIT